MAKPALRSQRLAELRAETPGAARVVCGNAMGVNKRVGGGAGIYYMVFLQGFIF